MRDEVALAWAAGLFEGEGSISHTKRCCLRLSLATTDLDVLDRFHTIIGVGSRGGWQGVPPRKYTYQWYVDGEAAAAVLCRLMPLLGERRQERARDVLAIREQYIAEATASRICAGCGVTFRPTFSTQAKRQRHCTPECYFGTTDRVRRRNRRRERAQA